MYCTPAMHSAGALTQHRYGLSWHQRGGAHTRTHSAQQRAVTSYQLGRFKRSRSKDVYTSRHACPYFALAGHCAASSHMASHNTLHVLLYPTAAH
jgi:hypothetical protein